MFTVSITKTKLSTSKSESSPAISGFSPRHRATLLVAIDRLYGRIEKHLRDASIDRSELKAMQNDVRELRAWACAETTDRVIGEMEVYRRLEAMSEQLDNFETTGQTTVRRFEENRSVSRERMETDTFFEASLLHAKRHSLSGRPRSSARGLRTQTFCFLSLLTVFDESTIDYHTSSCGVILRKARK
jgi:hypothetical protein